jgi:hypothetical protein
MSCSSFIVASPMTELGTSLSPRSWSPRSMRSATASIVSMLTGRFSHARFKPLTTLTRS